MARGVTGPRGERVFGQFAAVGVDLAEGAVGFIEDAQLFWGLEDGERAVEEPAVGRAGGETVGKRGTFAACAWRGLAIRGAGRRGEWFFTLLVIDKHVHEVLAVEVDVVSGGGQRTVGDVFAVKALDLAGRGWFDLPDSGEVGFAVGGSRRFCGEVGFTIRRQRRGGVQIIQPLGAESAARKTLEERFVRLPAEALRWALKS